jgi:hypothetical protein
MKNVAKVFFVVLALLWAAHWPRSVHAGTVMCAYPGMSQCQGNCIAASMPAISYCMQLNHNGSPVQMCYGQWEVSPGCSGSECPVVPGQGCYSFPSSASSCMSGPIGAINSCVNACYSQNCSVH